MRRDTMLGRGGAQRSEWLWGFMAKSAEWERRGRARSRVRRMLPSCNEARVSFWATVPNRTGAVMFHAAPLERREVRRRRGRARGGVGGGAGGGRQESRRDLSGGRTAQDGALSG